MTAQNGYKSPSSICFQIPGSSTNHSSPNSTRTHNLIQSIYLRIHRESTLLKCSNPRLSAVDFAVRWRSWDRMHRRREWINTYFICIYTLLSSVFFSFLFRCLLMNPWPFAVHLHQVLTAPREWHGGGCMNMNRK